jgi:hypothetical protein
MAGLTFAPTNSEAAFLDGLLGYWPFDGEGSDHSGAGRDVDLVGGIGFASGLFGKSLDLHANPSQYAVRGESDAVFELVEGDFTIQVWVNYNTLEREQNLIEKFEGATGPGWTLTSLLGDQNEAGAVHFWASDGNVRLYSNKIHALRAGVWQQIVARRSGETFDLLVNGVTVASTNSNALGTHTDFPLIIGRRNANGQRDFSVDGRLDEIAIWGRALSSSEISSLYNEGFGVPVRISGDFNGDELIDAADIDDLTRQSAGGLHPRHYDLNHDSLVNEGDVRIWIDDLFHSWVGDANLDWEFSSSDLVVVLSSGTYETDLPSVWSTGDFNGDGRTDSADLVLALADGGYEQGPRPSAAAVPEPSGVLLIAELLPLCWTWMRRGACARFLSA